MALTMNSTPRQQKVESVQELEISPDTLSFTQGKDAKNIKIKQFLCVRHAVPKTNLYQAILLENRSQDRHLERTLSNLSLRQMKNSNSLDLTARTFMAKQERKQKKWKREDELRLSSMNLPMLQNMDDRPRSIDVMYHMPDYEVRSAKRERPKEKERSKTFPKMPYSVRREQTEIVTHRERTCMTRLPEVVVVDQEALKHYDMYRGKKFLNAGVTKSDDRFQQLQNKLRPAILNKDLYPLENTVCKSRLSKYSNSLGDPDEDKDGLGPMEGPPRVKNNWMLTQPDTTTDSEMSVSQVGRPKREVTFGDPIKQVRKSDEILDSFKRKDIRKLSRTLAKEKRERNETQEQSEKDEMNKHSKSIDE